MHYFETEMHMSAHICYKILHCGIFIQHIVGFVGWINRYRLIRGVPFWRLTEPDYNNNNNNNNDNVTFI